jgi:hypothetical protein
MQITSKPCCYTLFFMSLLASVATACGTWWRALERRAETPREEEESR